jgi:hypothetical protein
LLDQDSLYSPESDYYRPDLQISQLFVENIAEVSLIKHQSMLTAVYEQLKKKSSKPLLEICDPFAIKCACYTM